ncbi:hypothetical protein [Micromonospora echinofusca]|uniref:DUF2236 domain-containing protein n=1 Tax=Micromonospora echinofusca TaxID=47858 RepID=A0ABS3VRU4_MICEH|nr:hypothetical protein [Micromonospora echinofusca]MBO4207109.1 hypothetical protein [Micromonospora echinofusca]
MLTFVRRAYRVVAVLITLCTLVGVARLVVPATAAGDGEPPGVRRQLTFLRAALEAGAGTDAQQLFPEGYFFSHVLYGLSRVELGMRAGADRVGTDRAGVDRDIALREARWALKRLDSPAGRAPFSADLTPPYGVFYQGWTTWLRGGIIALQPADRRDPGEVQRFAADAAALGAAFDASASPYLPAYPGQAWPVDSTVAVAALRLHDTLLPPRFAGTVQRWLAGVRQRLDPATGLLPHRVEPADGAPAEVARATSQSVIHRFLVEIDPVFAREQYLRFRDRYVTTPLGLGPAVREYPDGIAGPGDVDSGPLLLGVSLSATVVTMGAAQVQGDTALAGALANYGELAGLPVDTPWTKRYAFGLLPVGDAFLAWSKTARPWVAAPGPVDPSPGVDRWWRLPLLGLLLLVGALPWLPELLLRYRRRAGVRAGTRTGEPDAPTVVGAGPARLS